MLSTRSSGLDVLRGAAILLVLVSHGAKFLPDYIARQYADVWWGLGVVGVEFFYGLSGFLIGQILLDIDRHDASFAVVLRFLVRRWMRTLPLYWLAFLALLFVPGLDPNPPRDQYLYAIFSQNIMSPMPSDWFGPSWSLVIEEWSYVLLPFLAFGVLGQLRSTTGQRVAIAAIILVIAGLLARILLTDPLMPWDETVRKTLMTRLDALAYGVLAAWLFRYQAHSRAITWAARLFGVVAPVVMLASCALRYTPYNVLHGFFGRVLLNSLGGVGTALLALRATTWKIPSFAQPVGTFIARISYALYLVHWPFLYVALWAPDGLQMISFWIGTFVTATAISYGIEQPIMRLRPKMSAALTHDA